MITMCSCRHEAQDAIHGHGRRVYNMGKTKARCTVCKTEVVLTSEQQKSKTKSKK